MKLPIGLLGGTFDPIHYGHLRFAEDARAAIGLREVLLVPAGDPPHRARPRTLAADRLAMVRLAASDFAGLRADDRELRRAGPSYTVLTLEELRAESGDTPICLLLGMDALAELQTWHRWQDLFGLAHLVAAARPGRAAGGTLPPALAQAWHARLATAAVELAVAPSGRTFYLPIRPHVISATDLRARLARGERPADLLPPSVLAYIESHQLYRNDPALTDAH